MQSRLVGTALVFFVAAWLPMRAQVPESGRQQDKPDVVRVFTELVQTDVTVLDKDGRFVEGLQSNDFELRIDGQPKQIEFFQRVTAGSANEEVQLAAARGTTSRATHRSGAPVPLDRGRPVFFYLDDLHLDLTGLTAAQKVITEYVEKEMGQNDEAAITSASGQIGFLQQLTDNKAVLRVAIERLKVRPYIVRDFDRPAMTEYQALLIDNFYRDVKEYFIEETMRINPGTSRVQAESLVTSRASLLLQQAGRTTANTLIGLEGLVKSARTIPGRKLVFFISNGFFLDNRNYDANSMLRRITSAAAKNGVVIYSIDARGLVASVMDASSDAPFDPAGRLQRAATGEVIASQNGLNALASDTGGRAFFNSNSFKPALEKSLNETSSYYLLAWKPEREAKQSSKFRRIEVKVVGKPHLTVQVRRGFFDVEPETNETPRKKPDSNGNTTMDPSTEALRKLINSPFPDSSLPIALTLTYSDSPAKGPQLSVLMAIESGFLSYAPDVSGNAVAEFDVTGSFFNDRGDQGAEFSNRLTVHAPSPEAGQGSRDVGYVHTVLLKPGLYHVRVAARDRKNGKGGSAHGWIEIPNLASGQLALSTPIIGRRGETHPRDPATNAQNTGTSPQLSLTRNFPTNEFLRFLVFIYNAQIAASDSKPDVALQVQIVRDNQPVLTAPMRKISVEDVSDLKRVPYAAEVPLSGLRAGRYLLRLTILDRVSKRSASQQARFVIE